jgi:uncharacterized protein YegL
MDEGLALAGQILAHAPEDTQRDVILVTDGQPDDKQRTQAAARRVEGLGAKLSALAIQGGDVDEGFLRLLTPHLVVVLDVDLGQIDEDMGTLLRATS